MRHKYVRITPNTWGDKGRNTDPSKWVSGSDPLKHEKYYAWLKHRAQARHRKEDYELTWPQWDTIWRDELFLRRGRAVDDLCLQRIDPLSGWCESNVEITTRSEHLTRKRKRETDNVQSRI